MSEYDAALQEGNPYNYPSARGKTPTAWVFGPINAPATALLAPRSALARLGARFRRSNAAKRYRFFGRFEQFRLVPHAGPRSTLGRTLVNR